MEMDRNEALERFKSFCGAAGANRSFPNEEDFNSNLERLDGFLESVIFPLLPEVKLYMRCLVEEVVAEAREGVVSPKEVKLRRRDPGEQIHDALIREFGEKYLAWNGNVPRQVDLILDVWEIAKDDTEEDFPAAVHLLRQRIGGDQNLTSYMTALGLGASRGRMPR